MKKEAENHPPENFSDRLNACSAEIGIMCAMPQEGEKIKLLMERNISEERIGGTNYILGVISGKNTILAIPEIWGSTHAASITSRLQAKYHIKKLIFTGVAGSLCSDLKRGSIIISDALYYHDVSVIPIQPQKCYLGPKGPKFFGASSELKNIAFEAANEFIKTLSPNFLLRCSIHDPKVVTGTIATGNRFIGSEKEILEITTETPEAIAVEMEGAAVAQVCHDLGVDFVVIRTVSDFCDGQAHEHFMEFLAEAPSEYSLGIIRNMYNIGL